MDSGILKWDRAYRLLGSRVQGLGGMEAGILTARRGWHPGGRKAVPIAGVLTGISVTHKCTL